MTVKLLPNQAMQDCLAELVQGRKILHVMCEPSQSDINKYNNKKAKNLGNHKKPILCTTTGAVYDSIKQASIALRLDAGAISRCVSGHQASTKGYSFDAYLNKGTK